MINKLIYKINSYTNNYIKKKKLELEKYNDEIWNDKFKNSNKIIYNLTEKSSIYLYNDSVLSRLIFDGFEKEEIDFLTQNLKNGDIFIDIGANVGLFSLLASPLVGNSGKVIAFEPSPVTFERLKENIEYNKFENVEIVNKGISDKEGVLSINLYEEGYDAWNSFAPSPENFNKALKKHDVVVTTLDNELRNIDKSKIKLIKIDVEGWEKFVLNGAKDILENYAPIIMMEFTESNTFSAGYMVQELYDIMVEKGYTWYEFVEGKLLPSPKKIHYPYNNLFAIKN